MKKYLAICLGVFACVLATGCSGNTEPQSSASKIAWTRVKEVEVTSDTEAQSPADSAGANVGSIGPGASQSQVIMAWGIPDYIQDSASDSERKIWQYSHAVVVFQGTKVEKVLAR